MPQYDLSEPEYFRQIEQLARDVVNATGDDWPLYEEEPDHTPLQRAMGRLARAIRRYHYELDGCIEERDRPEVKLAGVMVIRPEAMPLGMDDTYEQVCEELGVEPRPEGWALWNTWDKDGRPTTMVVTHVATTERLVVNWSHRIEMYPVTPMPAQIVMVRQGWAQPMTFSPLGTRHIGLHGQP
jgi:hypothetical protein